MFSPQNLDTFSRAVHEKGAAIAFYWSFIDWAIQPLFRPGQPNQRSNSDPFCIYGDPAYPLRVHHQAPCREHVHVTEIKVPSINQLVS